MQDTNSSKYCQGEMLELKSRLEKCQDELEKAMQAKSSLAQELADAKQEVAVVQELYKKKEDDIEKAESIIRRQHTKIGELESKVKQQQVATSDKATSTDSLREGTISYIGRKENLRGPMRDSDWSLRLLGTWENGGEPGKFHGPCGLTWHADQLVICDTDNRRVQVLNRKYLVIDIIEFHDVFAKAFQPHDVTVSQEGYYFITDTGNNQIVVYFKKQIIKTITQPDDIAVFSITYMLASIFVTDGKGRHVIKFNCKDGKLIAKVRGQVGYPHSVANSNSNLFVSDSEKRVIHVLDSDLNFLKSYSIGDVRNVWGIDVNSHGIYVCVGRPSGVLKLKPNGEFECHMFKGEGFSLDYIAVSDDNIIALTNNTWSPYLHQIAVFSLTT